MPRRPVQLELPGVAPRRRAKGGGRKPKGDKAGASHLARPVLDARHPVHVTLSVRDDVPNLRRNRLLPLLLDTFRAARERQGFRVCHYVVMGNHVHLIVEADDKTRLARGIQGLSIRLARRLNQANERRGRFFAERYHARALCTPTDVHHTITYVLMNHRKHAAERGVRLPPGLDAFSSSAWFEGFDRPAPNAARLRRELHPPAVVAPERWLLREGWRRAGPISPDAFAV